MRGKSFYNRGESIVGIIIVFVVASLITSGLYLYFYRQIPKVSEVAKNPVKKKFIKPKERVEEKPILPPKEAPYKEGQEIPPTKTQTPTPVSIPTPTPTLPGPTQNVVQKPTPLAQKHKFTLIQDDGTLIRSGYVQSDYGLEDISGSVNKEAVIKKFFQDHSDAKNAYDFIILATTFKPRDDVGQFTATKNVIQGTGDSNDDVNLVSTHMNTGLTGEEGFQGYAFIANIDDIGADLSLLLHELSHRWLFRLGDYDFCGKGFGCTKETGFKINSNGAHYNDKINTITKEGGETFKDPNGGGDIQIGARSGYCVYPGEKIAGYRFTNLSLYLMGLVPLEEAGMLNWYQTSGAWTDQGIPCIEKKFTVQDVINMVGSRNPAYPNTQRDFTVALILLTQQGQTPTQSQLDKMNYIMDNFPREWQMATRHISTIRWDQ